MKYAEAVKVGVERAERAAELLRSIAGYSRPAIFLKPLSDRYEPVGEETFYTIITRGEFAQLALVDADGVVKAISQPMAEDELMESVKRLEGRGILKYEGRIYFF